MEKLSLIDILFDKDEQSDSEDYLRGKSFFTLEFSGSITKSLKRILSSRFFLIAKEFSYLISHVSAKIYGTAILCFGLLSTLLYFLRLSADSSIVTPIVGIIFACLSIPFLLNERSLPVMLQSFPLTDFLFFEFFCMKRHTTLESEKHIPIFLAVLIGIIPALVSIAVPLWAVALAIVVLICVYIGMESPEFLFLGSLALIPFLSFIPSADFVLGAVVLLSLISFMLKVVYGKRVIFVEQYDIFLLGMLLFILISGIFVKGIESFSGSLGMIVFAVGYPLSGNIISNGRLAERSINSIITSSTLASLVSLGQFIYLSGSFGPGMDLSVMDTMLARDDGLCAFFICSTVLSLSMFRQVSVSGRIFYGFSAIMGFVGIILSGEVFAILSLIVGGLAYLVIKYNKLVWLLLPTLLVVPMLLLLLSNETLNMIFSYSPSISTAEELFALWSSSLQAFLNNMFVGIGIGSESFAEEMAKMGIFGFNDSSNLFIELGLEAGVFALICLLMVIITRIRHRSIRYLYIRNSQIENISCASGVCFFCLLVFGMVNYIWSSYSIYYLFWCILGIGSATLRVAKRDYDDQVLYYEETSAVDSSVIDIEIG